MTTASLFTILVCSSRDSSTRDCMQPGRLAIAASVSALYETALYETM